MRIGIIGSGNIGSNISNIASRFALAGHEVLISFARDENRLSRFAARIGALIEDAGYVPADVGGTATCQVLEAPRRPGVVYGGEYRPADAAAVLAAVQSGLPIPPAPHY